MVMEMVEKGLFDVEADVYVITINLRGTMGAGVAKAARDGISGLYAHYKKMYRKINPNQFITYRHQGKLYLLVPTKIDWKDPSPRDLVVENFNRIAVLSYRHQWGKVALPPMGCGHGGLDWENDIRFVYKAILDHVEQEFIVTIPKRRVYNS